MRKLFLFSSLLILMYSCNEENQRIDFNETGDLEFKSQAEINAFEKKYTEKEKVVLGNLIISGTSISDLSPLNTIVSVRNFVSIYNTSLENLLGLNGIDSIGRSLHIAYNNKLLDITDLNPATIKNSVVISNNQVLKRISGLTKIEKLDENFEIEMNNSLVTINGFNKLKTIGGYLHLGHYDPDFQNDSLIEVRLDNLETVNGDFEIVYNHSLRDLTFNNLSVVGGDFRIELNKFLRDLNGFKKIENLKNFYIQNNASLKNLEGLDLLTTISGELAINGNDSLISLVGAPELVSIGGIVYIENNKSLTALTGFENVQGIHNLQVKFVGDGPFNFCLVKDLLWNNNLHHFNLYINEDAYSYDNLIEDCP